MAQVFDADANPEKRLFISLITRDISLADAIVDLTDNSVNAAMKPLNNEFSSSGDYHKLFTNKDAKPDITIKVRFDQNKVEVTDDANGIDFDAAQHEVFRFGHGANYSEARDRLSVYGIGMKRALFKIGKRIVMTSDHKKGGFGLDLKVDKWERDATVPWCFPITKRPPTSKTGTTIVITDLHKEIRSRIGGARFEHELIEKLSKVYSFFIGRVIKVFVNGKSVARTDFAIGDNYSHDQFKASGVDCSITAGIASPSGGLFLSEASGWFVFCNFRTVLYADKTPLTGWGGALPIFQPKHRPFLGIVSFVSANPEALPWTTTKGGINEDNLAWQEATLRMAAAAKPIIRFLDTRYSSEGTDVAPSGLAQLSGKANNVFDATVSKARTFISVSKTAPKSMRIQYEAKKSDIEAIRKHFGRSGMSASEVGRRTFEYFLKNAVGEK